MTKVTKIRSPSERFRRLVDLFMRFAEFVGANVMKEDYRINWLTRTVILFIICYFSFTVYSVYVGVVIDGDWTYIMQSMCMTGTGIQGAAKLINGIVNAPDLRLLRSKIDNLYEKYERKHEHYYNHLVHSMALAKRATFFLLLIYSSVTVGIISVPLYYRLVMKRKILVLEFFIPGINRFTDTGFTVHAIIHVICIFFGSFGNFASDTLCFVVVTQVPLFKNILKCKFDDLDEVLRKYPKDRKKSEPLLRDIFEWHQEYNMASDLAKNSFFWVIFVQIGTGTMSIICTIVCQFLGVLPAAPLYLLYSFVILYCYCGLGNLVDIANDDVTTCIYDFLWYELSVPEQKMVLIMLRESQQASGMSIGGVSPLTLNAALQLTKSIYTVAMLLNEFFD